MRLASDTRSGRRRGGGHKKDDLRVAWHYTENMTRTGDARVSQSHILLCQMFKTL